MHDDEFEVDAVLVRRLLARQFPQWADLSLAIPTPLGLGEPGEGYPWRWSVYEWLDGNNPVPNKIVDPISLAGRGVPLQERDADSRAAIVALKRGRGWALSIALIQPAYYFETNPALAENARHVISEVLSDTLYLES